MNPKASFQYLRVRMKGGGNQLELQSLDDFYRLATSHKPRHILQLQADEEEMIFGFHQSGSLIMQTSQGFETLEDYQKSMEGGFPDSRHFYEAREKHLEKYEDLQVVHEADITDLALYEKIKSLGFVNGYKDWTKFKKTNPNIHGPDDSVNNPLTLFRWAEEKSFENYDTLKTALLNGFSDGRHYKLAQERGYKNFADYDAGMRGGFSNEDEFRMGVREKVNSRKELLDIFTLKHVGDDKTTAFDQKALLVVLSRLPPQKKVSSDKLKQLLDKALNEFKKTESEQFPEWFTTVLNNSLDVEDFLASSEAVKRFGIYHAGEKCFETGRLNQRMVIINARDITQSNSEGARNILTMVNELKRQGFRDFTVIGDGMFQASVRNPQLMDEIVAQAKFLNVHDNVDTDVFLIQYVKVNLCLFISNNLFPFTWQVEPWLIDNLDYYRIRYKIDGKKVSLPDLEE
ncbi:MAG: hypothetical protein IPP77_02340 [Bacteroidetes bacterium]|nr:hypothetical protein [Bacteroidota bacterium]